MSSVLFFVMSVNEKNALAEENLNTRITLPRGIRKKLFPRDSSASLGMTGECMALLYTHGVILKRQKNTSPREIRKKSFSRDSSASLGMTGNKMLGMTHSFNCHVELVETSRGSGVGVTAQPNPRGGTLKYPHSLVAGN